MRKKVIIGNWKMNNDKQETENLLLNLKNKTWNKEIEVKVSPSFVNLEYAQKILKNSPVEVVAQNMHYEEKGAFTGEISYKMLKSINVNSVIIGHSERRTLFYENDDTIKRKIKTALDNEMKVIFCFGESLEDRKEKRHIKIISKQLDVITNGLKINQWNQIILAYEPVWAIGTGLNATPEQAQEIHKHVRKEIATTFNKNLADSVQILYGGSLKPNNSKEIFFQPDIDGGLIGGASLSFEDFYSIIRSIDKN
ncbi:MAG: triose-phosphate isomerase [Flavobacteriales bacterium]|nr:MAG: triose-phosphate isomerase [Flavobacteriales bacterium TMED96]RZP10091.1 MAG: triose-phosphate isomerase [Flavobacteriales bacterium]|tara:strand:- start:56 stop:814 length:759 start_codon:yes stop_codon:yes gene_type:complete